MRRGLNGRVAVVTGASSGIGRATAMALAAEGARIALIGRDEGRLRAVSDAIASPCRSMVVTADLGGSTDIRTAATAIEQEFGHVDILVHSAGTISIGPFHTLAVDALDEQYRVNVRAPFLLTQVFLPGLLRARGQIVFVNSSAGLVARAGVSQYAATKHALKALADSLREEVHSSGVRVISVFPGRTATPMQAAVRRMEGRRFDPDRSLRPEDVAFAIITALTLPETAEIKDLSIRPMQE